MTKLQNNRPWDQKNEFVGGELFSSTHWAVEISYRQHTPGSFIVFAQSDVQKMSELTSEAMGELPAILHRIEQALAQHPLLHPDWFNYLQLGNAVRHLHIHGIPRYKEPRTFMGNTWVDTTYGMPPVWSTNNITEDQVRKISQEIRKYL